MSCLKDFTVLLVLLIVQSSHGADIIGGKPVKPHSLPFMVRLEGGHICGGILIDPFWVLTAAHCKGMNKVLLGVHSISKDKTNTRQVRNIEKEVPHEHYHERNNDLMLVKLDKSAGETDTVKYLKLGETATDPANGTSCLVAGWGTTNYTDKTMSDVLRSVNVTVIDREKCKSHYNNIAKITNNMICAGALNTDACVGDSGGPLICGTELVGVVSFGPKKCGESSLPGVYAFLSKDLLGWIKKTIKSQR